MCFMIILCFSAGFMPADGCTLGGHMCTRNLFLGFLAFSLQPFVLLYFTEYFAQPEPLRLRVCVCVA